MALLRVLVVDDSAVLEPETRKEALVSGATACLEKGAEIWNGLRTAVERALRLMQRTGGP